MAEIDVEKMLIEKSKSIDKAIEKWLPRKYDAAALERTFGKARFKYNVDSANRAIAEPVWDLLDRGGKRWRPALLLFVCEALGGDDGKFTDWAIIPELVHNGTLMVDDVEDSSELRRGKPCTYKTFGVDIAVNAGNALYYIPLRVLLESKIPPEQLKKAYEIYAQEMVNISYGQAMDIAWHRGLANADKISEDEYLQMCAYKTGTLARMAAKLGAVAAGAGDKTIEKVGRLAESLGIAFQVQDDVLNLTAQEGKGQFTKDYIGEDIREGKRTLMVIYALSKAATADKKRLIEILSMHTPDRKLIREAIEIIQKYGAVEYARERASELVRSAWKDCEKLFKAGDARDAIAALVKFAAERKW
jgi:geranylgeranyl pyrophosphate synthase